MANKMFYTVEEAAAKLGMSVVEVQGLGDSGQLQEFRDRDRLMFKREQVDLLAGHHGADDDIDEITLAESGELEPLSLSSSGSGSAFSSAASGTDTGVSIFDPDDSGADANADTLVTAFGDAGASGSGLANMAFESDDTSLGGDLLADLGDSGAGQDLGGSSMGESSAGSLFEGDSGEPDYAAGAAVAAPMMVQGDAYDGAGSGFAAGAALAMTLVLLGALAVMLLSLTGSGSAAIFESITKNTVFMVLGGGIVAVALFGGIGFAVLRKS